MSCTSGPAQELVHCAPTVRDAIYAARFEPRVLRKGRVQAVLANFTGKLVPLHVEDPRGRALVPTGEHECPPDVLAFDLVHGPPVPVNDCHATVAEIVLVATEIDRREDRQRYGLWKVGKRPGGVVSKDIRHVDYRSAA